MQTKTNIISLKFHLAHVISAKNVTSKTFKNKRGQTMSLEQDIN